MSSKTIITSDAVDRNYWRDLWNYRGLFFFLAWRDVLVRYKQTAVGIAWAVIRPLLTILVFWVVGWIFNLPDEGVPRIILVTAAIIPWTFFSAAFSESANSLIANANLLTKVYFPRLIVPISSMLVCLIDLLISLVILFVIMIALAYTPSWHLILLPLFMLLAIITASGAGLLIAALNVKYRDFRYVIPFIVQFGLYVSPVAFSSNTIYHHERIPEWLKMVYACNPMVGVIDGFRWCITGGQVELNMTGFIISIVISSLLLIAGFNYFRRTEKSFADNV